MARALLFGLPAKAGSESCDEDRAAPQKRVLVMGAGDAGAMIAREMHDNPQLGLIPVGFVDDNKSKHGVRIHGVPVLGGREHIAQLAREHDVAEVIIAIPTASGLGHPGDPGDLQPGCGAGPDHPWPVRHSFRPGQH